MVDGTLKQLDAWYNEPSQGGDRPKLLSKLATLELCGWIEGEFDRLALLVDTGRLNDPEWVKTNVISRTSGFTYSDHWRPMLSRLVGEVFSRRVEEQLDRDFPVCLDQLKGLLMILWKVRCDFAHADINANLAAQQTFNAPSWTINKHRILKKLIAQYEQTMLAVLAVI
ncbi:MAG: hypothetical protein Q7U07_01850 [Gammaproteobacteria bacterium]|nr:hypothetical protein [Gammaproteobacteria bacterium]